MILVKHFDHGHLKPPFYWSLESYLLEEKLQEDEIYFFTWPVEGVIIGKNQILENEVNQTYLREHQIPVYRRPSGGGAVYADAHNLMFSIIRKKTKDFTFKKELEKIVEALRNMGIPVTFSGRNDMLVDGLKVSGNSFIQNKWGVILHGTLLFQTDLETMVRSLTPSDEKLVSKGIDSVRSRVTNLCAYLPHVTKEQFRTSLEEQMATASYVLSEDEIQLIDQRAERYFSKDWIYDEQPEYTKIISIKTDGGMVNLHVGIAYKKITVLRVLGDFFEINPISTFEKAFENCSWSFESIADVLSKYPISDYVFSANQQQFIDKLRENFSE